LEKQFQISNEVDNIQEWVELISRKFPEEADAAQEIARYLLDRLDKLPFETGVPIHKDFHYEHILVDGGLKVIDFDEVRLGDPNLDLAHFCANFYLLAYRKNSHPAQFARLQHRFLETYALHSGWSLDERFVFFYAYSCLKLAKQLCKKRGPRPFPEGEEQRAQVWLMLEQGLTTLLHTSTNGVIGEFPLPIMDFSKERRTKWSKATRISKSDTSSAATRVSHKLLS
jgi:aminoglycoside phosphotransferase (APT) family kinase protein